MGRARSTDIGDEECIQDIHEKARRKQTTGGGSMWAGLTDISWCGMDWIRLAQNTGQWRALVNMVMNVWVP